MPRGVKQEGPDEEELNRAAETVSSYKDRLDEWRQLDDTQKRNLLRYAYMTRGQWNCLSSECGKPFISPAGLQYHLDRCGLSIRKKRQEAAPSTSEAVGEEDSGEQQKRKMKRDVKIYTHAKALEIFNSYKDRLDKWREISEYEQNNILRYVYRGGDKTWGCLSSTCKIKLSTPGGLCYHMQRCGIPQMQRGTRCGTCGETVPKWQLSQHLVAAHGVSVGMYMPAMAKNLRKEDIETSENSNEETENATVETSDGDDSSPVCTALKRRRAHVSFAKASFGEYRGYVTQAYEAFKAEASGGVVVDFPEDLHRTDWILLNDEECDGHIPTLLKSIPFCTDGQKDAQTLKRFESLKTPSGFIAFCGGAISIATWCPIDKDNGSTDQYLLVAANMDGTIGITDDNRSGTLQLWRHRNGTDFQLVYVISHEYGTIMDMKWCPSGQWDPEKNQLGFVAVTSVCGRVFVHSIRLDDETTNRRQPKVFKALPSVQLSTGTDSPVYTLDWSLFDGHDEIIAGLDDGTVCLWRLSTWKDVSMRNEENQLLPVHCMDVASGPVRFVRWWTRSKVFVSSMDYSISMWDLENSICISQMRTYRVAGFASVGSFFPGIVYGVETSQMVPYVSISDFMYCTTKGVMHATSLHSSTAWGISINPWSGEVLSVDDLGTVCRSCTAGLEGIFTWKRRKFVDQVVMKSVIQCENTDPVYSYGEAEKRCSVKFTFKNKMPTREQVKNEFKSVGLSDQFPVNALFTAAWNLNRNSSRWCCFGGQNGLLHVIHFKDDE